MTTYYRFICLFSILLMLIAGTTYAARDEATAEGIWNFDNGDAVDTSGKGVNGRIVGAPEVVEGIAGTALLFDGFNDGIKLPDSVGINAIAAPGFYTDRTIACYFNCTNVDITAQKQTIFEEGGLTRGMVLYVFDGRVYVAAWNRAEYNWNGAWPSAPVESGKWYHIGLVIRDAAAAVEPDKFEMWLNGALVASEAGGVIYGHGDDIGVAHVNSNAVFHDDEGGGHNIHYFGGIIDELIVYGSAFDAADFSKLARPFNVEPSGKSTTTWAALKSQRAP